MPSSDHARAFYREVAVAEEVYGLEFDDGDGLPLWPLADDRKARPFWSSFRRISEMLNGPLARKRLRIVAYTWHGFATETAPELEHDHILIGVNWHGPKARGYNMKPTDVLAAVERERERLAPDNDDPNATTTPPTNTPTNTPDTPAADPNIPLVTDHEGPIEPDPDRTPDPTTDPSRPA